MFGTHNLALFLATSIGITLIPGPSTIYILGRSVSMGRKAGVLSVLGIGTGTLCHTLAVAFGLSALLAASQVAFTVLKFAGAGYLIYLGIKVILTKPSLDTSAALASDRLPIRKVYGQGFVTQILNPKATLFFAALLPQFVRTSEIHSPIPFLFLGALFVTFDTLWFLMVACGSALVSAWLRRSAQFQSGIRWATGALYIGLGLNLLRLRARASS